VAFEVGTDKNQGVYRIKTTATKQQQQKLRYLKQRRIRNYISFTIRTIELVSKFQKNKHDKI
jgi:hypothetical protein